MIHYELIKLVPGTDIVEVQQKISKTLKKLDDELDWLNRPVVYRDCAEGKGSFDLMAVIDLEGPERLGEFLANPHTVKLNEALSGAILGRMAFDHY